MANRRFIDFPIAASVGNNDIVLIWQDGLNKQTTKATLLQGSPQSLAGLTDVDISALNNGQILQYNSTTSKWENVDRTDINLSELGDVTIVAPANGQVLVYNSSTSKWENSSGGYVPYTGAVTTVNLGAQSILAGSFVKAGGTAAQFLKANGSVDSTAYGTGSVTSVALTMPTAFSVAGSPITTAGTLAVTGAGTVGQYIRGDGSLADFPATTGGGSSVSYYLNGSVSQGTIGGVAYKELNRAPVFGAGTDITINADGYIASFITDALDPNKLLIPAGNWNFETYFSANSGGGSPSFYVELYKYNGSTFTLIASSSAAPELIAFGTSLNPYYSTLAVPETVLALTDRLALRYYVTHSGRTITLHTENGHLCEVITTFTTGLTALNGLTNQVQFFAVGTAGTDFAISSVTDTHTFNLPTASATNRGALSSADWTTFNGKTSNLGTVTSVGLSSATSGVTIGSTPVTTSGTITLAIATASGSQNGLLSSTDWTTFNNKANSVAGGYLPLSGGTMTGVITTPNGTFGIIVGDDSRLADRNIANTLFVEGVQNTDRGYINFSETSGNALGAINAGNLTWRGNAVVTGTGTTNYLPKFTGSTTIGNSLFIDTGSNAAYNNAGVLSRTFVIQATSGRPLALEVIENANVHAIYFHPNNSGFNRISSDYMSGGVFLPLSLTGRENNSDLVLQTNGNVTIGTTTDAGFKLDVNGTGRFSGALRATEITSAMPSGNGALYINNSSLTNKNWTFIPQTSSSETDLLLFYTGSGAGTRLTIASTGAATFSQAQTFATILLQNGNNSAYSLYQAKTNNSDTWQWGCWNDNSYRVGKSGIADYFLITSSGNTAFNSATDGGYGFFVKDKTSGFIFNGRAQGSSIWQADNNANNSIVVYSVSQDAYNTAGTTIILGRNSSTSRSINAGGTVNALGTDYAEYMTKGILDDIKKGDIVGVDKNGLLTNIFGESESFVVKSTNPSFVGGDIWGSVDHIGKLANDATDEQKAEHEAKLELARTKVDRIAFSGQVPCNVYDCKVGDYIIPINVNGKIKGQAVRNPTFEQYQISIGKVWKIMEDGRAWIAVKIG